MINIMYLTFPMRAQTENTTFSCKDDCTLTKHTWRWTYSAFQCLFYLYSVSLGDALTTADVQPFFAKNFLLGKKNRKFLGKGGLRHKFEWTLVRITKKLSFCPFKPWSTNFFGNFLTLIRWANCPQQIKKMNFLCNRISILLYYNVCLLSRGLSKKIDLFWPWRELGWLFIVKGPQKSALQGPFQGPFGGPWRPMRVPWTLVKDNNDHKRVPWCSEGLENVFF